MRVTKEKASENRETILQAAAEQVRAVGFDRLSVADVGRAAGMTHGALYSNFKSKEELKSAATKRAFDDSVRGFTGLSPEEFLTRYLSTGHRDNPQIGCPNSALVSDVWRQPIETQEVFKDGVGCFVSLTSDTLNAHGAQHDYDRAVTIFAAMVGGLSLARAIRNVDPDASDQILQGVARQLSEMVENSRGQAT